MKLTLIIFAALSSAQLVSCSSNPVMIVDPEERPPGELTPGPVIGMEFAYIPPGTFQMGSPTSDSVSVNDERPVHTVTFEYTFEILNTEVTQAMWEEVMESNPSFFLGENRPVENVSWDDCQEYLTAMNQLDPSYEYRLPSEAEWEYCCRSGVLDRFYWGDDPVFNGIGDYAWFRANSFGETHPAAEKEPTSWGLFDMSGNVWEWCQDYWHDDYTRAPSDGSAWLSPSSSYRVGRGGSWGYTAQFCRSANRGIFDTTYRCDYLGLRLVRMPR